MQSAESTGANAMQSKALVSRERPGEAEGVRSSHPWYAFDTADGRKNHSYAGIKTALADGFVPERVNGIWKSGLRKRHREQPPDVLSVS